jgi:hypothetical protein
MIFQKINASYIDDEDRLLLRISTANFEEFRLWMTRRSCLNLLIETESLSISTLTEKHSELSAKTIDSFNQESLEKKINFQASYTPTNKLPFGGEPILIKSISIKRIEDKTELSLALANRKTITTQMDSTALNAIRLLFKRSCIQSGWLAMPVINKANQTNLSPAINLH